MLKKWGMVSVLTIVAICFLSAQKMPPDTPKQGIGKPGSSQNGGGQPQSEDSKQAAHNAVPTTPQPATPTCDEACEQGRQNLAIQGKLELFTGGLVVVGVLQAASMIWQAVLLWGTLKKIDIQAFEMSRQADLTGFNYEWSIYGDWLDQLDKKPTNPGWQRLDSGNEMT